VQSVAANDSASPAASRDQQLAPPPAAAPVKSADTAAVKVPVKAPAPSAMPAPTIAIGESPLAGGILATRTESGVTLAFDTPMARTRIPEKFEQLVRATLPQIYGHALDSALAKIPKGGLVRQGNLVSELPTRGIHVPVTEGWTLAVYPETRPGQDGPLVVRYRAVMEGKAAAR